MACIHAVISDAAEFPMPPLLLWMLLVDALVMGCDGCWPLPNVPPHGFDPQVPPEGDDCLFFDPDAAENVGGRGIVPPPVDMAACLRPCTFDAAPPSACR